MSKAHALCLVPMALASLGWSPPAVQPVAVPFQIGNAGFAPGDAIDITAITGDRPGIEVGGHYHVEGTWKLASRDAGLAALFSTNGEITGAHGLQVRRGAGTFAFDVTVEREGYLHVSFYPEPQGTSFGGLYFGTGTNVYRGGYVPGP
jgi:hypothetical protein